MFKRLAISLTRKCNATCRHCCFECSPNRTETLTKECIHKIISEAKEIGAFNVVSFSGGEAILCMENLLYGIKYAKHCGFKVTCLSNGFWGKDKEQAYEVICKLKKAGLDELSLSYDEFHEEFISIECIKNIIVVCRDQGIPCHIGIGITKSSKTAGHYIDQLGINGFNASYEFYPIIPVGEAEKNFLEKDFYKPFSNNGLRCPNSGFIAIFYDGDIFPCCSQVMKNTQLSIGNAYNESLSEAIANAKGNLALFIIWTKGFDWFKEIIEENSYKKLKSSYVSPCHLCKELFSDEELIKKMIPHMKEEVEQYVKATT